MKKAVVITIIAVIAILILATILLIIHKESNSSASPQQETQISGTSSGDVNSVGQDVNNVNDSDFSDNSLDNLG